MKIFLSIGSNSGDRDQNLMDAYRRTSKLGKVNCSHIYKTESWGREDLPEFLNACVGLETEIPLLELFSRLQEIEKKMGRDRIQKWAPRKIDIDILLCENLIFRNSYLEIPHKYLQERRFYLEPLNEIASDELEPITGKSINELLSDCMDEKKVWKIGTILQLKAS